MKILKTFPHLTDSSVKTMMNTQTDIRAFKDWQIIYSVQTNFGKQAEEIACILGVKKSKVYNVVQLYNKHGKTWRSYDQWGGRRDARCHLTLEDEKLFMQSLEDDALSGNILTFRHIKDKVEIHVGKPVSDDYTCTLLALCAAHLCFARSARHLGLVFPSRLEQKSSTSTSSQSG